MKSLSTPQTADVLHVQDLEENSKKRVKQQVQKTTLAFWGFVGPLIIGLIVFFYIPIIWGFLLSFADARATVTPTQFVGFQNYATMLSDPVFTHSLITFIIFTILVVPLTFICSLALALLVNQAKVAQGFFRSVFFLPTACSYVLASLVWKMIIFNGSSYGLANSLRHVFGLDPISWISSPNPPWYWVVLVSVRLWIQLGLYMIIFIAGLQDIPRELYEAAFVDGARKGWQTFWAITFPLLRNTSVSILLLNVIAALQAFDEFYNIMTGGNNVLARPPLAYIYDVALTGQNYGTGSAGAMILTLIIVVVSLAQGRLLGFGSRD